MSNRLHRTNPIQDTPRAPIERAEAKPTINPKPRSQQQGPGSPQRASPDPKAEPTQTTRHTTHPPVPCLGRSFLIENVRKGPRRTCVVSTAPPGGRFWHGFAVRRPPVGRGGWSLTFGPVFASGFEGVLNQTPLSFDNRGMDRNSARSPAFFTERTLAAYLSVSDRTIRNWIRRGDLPSYKLGAARRIDPADVEDFLARRRDEAA